MIFRLIKRKTTGDYRRFKISKEKTLKLTGQPDWIPEISSSDFEGGIRSVVESEFRQTIQWGVLLSFHAINLQKSLTFGSLKSYDTDSELKEFVQRLLSGLSTSP